MTFWIFSIALPTMWTSFVMAQHSPRSATPWILLGLVCFAAILALPKVYEWQWLS